MNLTPPTSDAAASIRDNVPEAYVRFDSEFRYGFVNRAAEQLLGKNRADLLGKVLWDVYPELGGTLFEGNYRRAMAERATITFEDFWEPQQRWYGITVTAEPEGGIVVRLADLTERKRAGAIL
jgi:PAS domain S-box-containing protein